MSQNRVEVTLHLAVTVVVEAGEDFVTQQELLAALKRDMTRTDRDRLQWTDQIQVVTNRWAETMGWLDDNITYDVVQVSDYSLDTFPASHQPAVWMTREGDTTPTLVFPEDIPDA